MSDPIEAAARAMWNEESRRAAGCDRRIQWHDEHPNVQDAWRGLARAAIDAYERSQWVDAEACINDDGNEFITEDGSVVFWHDGNDNYWKLPGWYDVRDSILTGKRCQAKRLRPLPQPPESERGE